MEEKIHGVYEVKGISQTNTAIIKCIGYMAEGKKIVDELLQCNNDSFPLDQRHRYDIDDKLYAEFFRCKITDTYIMSHKTLPMMYASIYQETIAYPVLLFNIFINFRITDDIREEKSLINVPVSGKYYISVRNMSQNASDGAELETFLGKNKLIEKMKEMIKSEEVTELIKKIKEERRLERVKEYGSIDEIVVPKPKYNFNKLVSEYRKTNKIDLGSSGQ